MLKNIFLGLAELIAVVLMIASGLIMCAAGVTLIAKIALWVWNFWLG